VTNPLSSQDLTNRFTYHPPNEDADPFEAEKISNKYRDTRAKALEYAEWLNENLPVSREASTAFTKLEEVVFWANAAIARH
jgi:hypothetical protein